MIEVRKIPLSGLKEYIESDKFQQMPDIPISPQRANSYLHNPRADKDDIVLFLAFENENLVGYRTVLPDKLYTGKREVKFGWLSGNWVLLEKRRQGIATLLFKYAYNEWNGKLMYTNYAPESKAVYEKSGKFLKYLEIQGIRAHLRNSFGILLPPKHIFFRKIKPLLFLSDFMFNFVHDLRIIAQQPFHPLQESQLEFVDQIDNDIVQLISKSNDSEPTRRSKEELEWIIKYPWIIEHDGKNKIKGRYFFSSVARNYSNIALKVFDKRNIMIAFIMMIIIGEKLTIPYCYCLEEHYGRLADIIFSLMLKKRINYVTVFHSRLAQQLLKKRYGFVFKKKMVRIYFSTTELFKILPEAEKISFQDGDGDVAFT